MAQGASMMAQMVKNPPAMQDTWVRSLGWEDPLEEGMATHSSIVAWRIPMDRVGYSPWGRTESDMTERLSSSTWPRVWYILVYVLWTLEKNTSSAV